MDDIRTGSRISRRARQSATSPQWRALGGGRAASNRGRGQGAGELQEGGSRRASTGGRKLAAGELLVHCSFCRATIISIKLKLSFVIARRPHPLLIFTELGSI